MEKTGKGSPKSVNRYALVMPGDAVRKRTISLIRWANAS